MRRMNAFVFALHIAGEKQHARLLVSHQELIRHQKVLAIAALSFSLLAIEVAAVNYTPHLCRIRWARCTGPRKVSPFFTARLCSGRSAARRCASQHAQRLCSRPVMLRDMCLAAEVLQVQMLSDGIISSLVLSGDVPVLDRLLTAGYVAR